MAMPWSSAALITSSVQKLARATLYQRRSLLRSGGLRLRLADAVVEICCSCSRPLLAHSDERHLDRPPSLSGHCRHAAIFGAQRSLENDPTRKSSGLDVAGCDGPFMPADRPPPIRYSAWRGGDLGRRRPDSRLLMLTMGKPISRGCQMRLREFIAHAIKERVGPTGIVLLAAAGLVLATSVGVFAAGDREDCAATGNPDQSIAACARVIADNTETAANRAVAYKNRGNVYFDKKDYDRAIADDSEAIKLDPKLATAYNRRGVAYLNKRDLDRAFADYNEAINLSPNFAAAYNNRGGIHQRRNDFDLAFADYSEAIRRDPNYAIAYNNRGVIYARRYDYAGAIADYGEAIRH